MIALYGGFLYYVGQPVKVDVKKVGGFLDLRSLL